MSLKVKCRLDPYFYFFYGWIKKMLTLNEGELPADALLAFLFQNPSRDKEFFGKLERKKSMKTLSDFEHGHIVRVVVDDRSKKKEGYHTAFTKIAEGYNLWVPDMFDEIDLIDKCLS